MPPKTKTKAEELVKQLRAAAVAYYNGGELLMSDETYDEKLEELRAAAPDHPYLEEIGSAPVASSGTVKLPFAMPSLDKIKPAEDRLGRFLQGAQAQAKGFVISDKLDGLSALWVPHQKALYLRGDGLVGQDISHLVPLGLGGLAASAGAPAVRGEILLPRSEGEPLARSWVNGLVHRKEPDPKDVKRVRFVAYEMMGSAPQAPREDQFKWLQKQGYEVPWWQVTLSITEAALCNLFDKRRTESPYDTDGLVVGINQPPKSESTADKARNPKDCVAFKKPIADQSAATTVKEVIWTASNQGYLIPKLHFEPITVGSATIQFCTAHNAKTVQEGRLGPGAKIVVRRSGDVIPKLDTIVTAAPAASFPEEGTYEWDATRTHIRLKAGDTESNEIRVARLAHFLKTLDIPGSGPATAMALLYAGIYTPSALWAIKAEKLSEILGSKTGSTLWTQLRLALEKADELRLMIASSCMPRGVGETKLKLLFDAAPDPREWTSLVGALPIGWTMDSLEQFKKAYPAYEAWRQKELSWIPYPVLPKKEAKAAAANAQTLCFTGFRDKDLESRALAAGHTVSGSLTSKVTILIVPDDSVKESEKVKSAREKGVHILRRGEFEAQYLTLKVG